MRRGAVLLLGLGALGLGVPGCTPAPVPLCQRPEVLQEVGRVVRLGNVYSRVEEASAQEAPGPVADRVACAVLVRTVGYLPAGAGWQAEPVRAWRRYDVQVGGNRFAVQVLP